MVGVASPITPVDPPLHLFIALVLRRERENFETHEVFRLSHLLSFSWLDRFFETNNLQVVVIGFYHVNTHLKVDLLKARSTFKDLFVFS